MVTPSSSRHTYADCFELFDKALDDAKGIRIKFSDYASAWSFRLRLHCARRIDRRDNLVTYEESHPMHGRSPYDKLIVRLKPDEELCWLHIENVDTREFVIESLSGEEQ